MQLELDNDDVVLLKQVLDRHLGNLRMEISDTDNADWRKALHDDEDRLKKLIARLGS